MPHLRSSWLRLCGLFLVTLALAIGSNLPAQALADPSLQMRALQTQLESRTGYRLIKPVIISTRESDRISFIGDRADRNSRYARTNHVVGDPNDLDSLNLASRIGSGPITNIDACLVVLTESFFDGSLTQVDQKYVLAHELAHCYQTDRMGGLINTPEEWVQEGIADWIGRNLVNSTSWGEMIWRAYIGSIRSLDERSYEASPFFSHLAYQGIDVWNLLDRFYAGRATELSRLDSQGKFELLMRLAGQRDRLLQTWPMGLDAEPDIGRDWDTDDPDSTGESRSPQPLAAPSTTALKPTAPYLWQLTLPTNKIVTVNIDDGYGAIRFDSDVERFSGSFSKRYCVGDTCDCDGSTPSDIISVPTPDAILAVVSDFTPGSIDIQVEDVPCEETPAEDTEITPSGPEARGSSYGDPHIITFDGYRYSFQTVGEFVLSKSLDNHFEVQARQRQVPNMNHLSLNTAAAMKVAGHRVVVYAQDMPDGETPLWIDGIPTELDDGTLDLFNGGTVINHSDRSYSIRWPSGEHVELKAIQAGGQNFINITPYVPQTDANQLTGLLGDLDGRADNDLRSRTGQLVPTQDAYAPITQLIDHVIDIPIPLNNIQQAFFEQLYRQFGDSWRITQDQSLFDYAPGQTTDTFTNRAFPDRFPTLLGVAPAQIRNATRLCQEANIEATFLEGCVFDIAATGETDFLSAAVNAIADAAIEQVTDRVIDEVQDEIRDRLPIPIPGGFF